MKYEMTVHLYKHTIHFFFDRLNEWKKYHFQLQTMDHDTVNIEIYIILVTWDTDAHTFTSVWHPSAIWVATKIQVENGLHHTTLISLDSKLRI